MALISPAELLSLRAQQMPDAIALQHDDTEYDFRRLDEMVSRMCGVLVEAGLKPGQTLACLDENRLLTALLVFALPRMGCRFLPLNPALPDTLIRELLQRSDANLLVGSCADLQPGCGNILSSDLLTTSLDREIEAPVSAARGLAVEETHLLIASSGTEGAPRLVMLSGVNLMSSVRASRRRIPIRQTSNWLLCLPLFHIGGLSVLLRCAEAGAKVTLHSKFDARRVLNDMNNHDVSHVSLVPTMLTRMRREQEQAMPPQCLETVLVGGAAIDPQLERWAEQRHWPLCPSYGLTEAASQVATRSPPVSGCEPGNVGQVLEHMQLRIDRKTGRIRIRGEGLMQGYMAPDGKPELPLVDGWFETGDIGQVNERGELVVLGRFGEQLISGGENIHPVLIENQLRLMDGVTDVAVTALCDPEWGDKVVALYIGAAEEKEVEEWAKRYLRGVLRPKLFRKVETLPYSDTGKLQRNLLIQAL